MVENAEFALHDDLENGNLSEEEDKTPNEEAVGKRGEDLDDPNERYVDVRRSTAASATETNSDLYDEDEQAPSQAQAYSGKPSNLRQPSVERSTTVSIKAPSKSFGMYEVVRHWQS